MTEIEKKTGMTDAECEELDNLITSGGGESGPNLVDQGVKPGFAWKTLLLSDLDQDVADYLRKRAEAAHKSQKAIINDLVHEKLAVGV
jgi:hypothetical protein